jgi:hypothetical protein
MDGFFGGGLTAIVSGKGTASDDGRVVDAHLVELAGVRLVHLFVLSHGSVIKRAFLCH